MAKKRRQPDVHHKQTLGEEIENAGLATARVRRGPRMRKATCMGAVRQCFGHWARV